MQRKKLTRLARRATAAGERQRCLIVLKYDEGKGCTTIAKELHCNPSTPPRVARRFLALGYAGLVDGRADNGTRKASEECYTVLARLLEGSPRDYGWARPTWTLEVLAEQIASETGTSLCVRTVSTMLKVLGARKGRSRPIVGCPWGKKARERRLRELRALVDDLPDDEVVLYEDEVDIHLNPKIGADWMLPGTQKTVLTPGKNEKHYLAGALDAKTGEVHYVDGPRKRSALFVTLVLHLAKKCYPTARRIHLIVDNYVIHTSQITRRALEELDGRVVLHFLPPYCPQGNRIEMLWKQLHDNVTRNHRCATMEELLREVHAFLATASPFPGSRPSLRRSA